MQMQKMEQLTSKETLQDALKRGMDIKNPLIMTLKRASKITPTTLSDIDNEKTIRQIVREKINYLVEQNIKAPPFFFWLSVEQILYSMAPWKESPDPSLKYGILNHIGVNLKGGFYHPHGSRKPTNREQLKFYLDYGSMIDFPPQGCRETILNVVRNDFIYPFLDDRIKRKYRVGPAFGYIRFDPRTGIAFYDEAFGWKISGYFFDNPAPCYDQQKKEYLSKADEWLRMQWCLFTDRIGTACIQQKASGIKRIARAEAMQLAWKIDDQGHSPLLEYLKPDIDENKISWNKAETGEEIKTF